jgi:uncharacterized protein (DUF1501 family)
MTPPADLYGQIAALHKADPLTGPAIAEGLRGRGFTASLALDNPMQPEKDRHAFATLAAAAGKMLGDADGPRIAAMELGGWDTHVAQIHRLAGVLKQLDAGLAAMKEAMGAAAWKQTAVLVMTEFGRTVRVNGTKGTDHGTGTVAFLTGGAVAGGRVVADWPGLGPGKLLEDRDLLPTRDLRTVARGVLSQHLGLGVAALAQVFPSGGPTESVSGLIRV